MRIRIVDEPPPAEGQDELSGGITRRQAVGRGAAALGAVSAGPILAACGGSSSSGGSSGSANTLRVLGIGVDQNPVLKAQAKKDLGITLNYTITDTPTTTQKSITEPQNYDVAHIYVHQVPQILPAGVMQPLDVSKIHGWTGGTTLWHAPSTSPTNLSVSASGFQDPAVVAGVAPILTLGKLSTNPGASYGVGDAAFRMIPLKSATQLTTGATPFDAALSTSPAPSHQLMGMPG
ncbi:MAG: hypothetical protein ACTHQQ_05315, partial [Solirubrobacteraceae bacterium]